MSCDDSWGRVLSHGSYSETKGQGAVPMISMASPESDFIGDQHNWDFFLS